MKRIFLSMLIASLSVGFTVQPVEAKRLGGGGSQGIKRQLPPRQQPTQPPAQQQQAPAQNASPTAPNQAAAPGAAAPRRSWLGPVAGLAAGLGLVALMSHLGLGAQFAEFLMLALLVLVGFMLIRFVARRMAGKTHGMQRAQLAGAGAGNQGPAFGSGGWQGTGFNPAQKAAAAANASPLTGADADAFERAAKMIFIRMQAANDAGDLAALRQFSTPDMFTEFRRDLDERQGRNQRTDVLQLNAQILDAAEQGDQQIVSVHFSGLLREEEDGNTIPLDETWHLMRPSDGSRDWAVAGIEQNEPAH